ncbi:MAG: GNAT family N-acetyltransferase [Thermodesulfobacteriota bacterium]|nr:GNAT family N-acetyltransferase [Thermodesulfobacteriota bacterium]
MRLYSSVPSSVDEYNPVRHSIMKEERNRLTFGNLVLFSFNLKNRIPDVKEGIPTHIEFISDMSFFKTVGLPKKDYVDSVVFRDRFHRGDICCVAKSGGKIVSYCWISLNSAHIEEIDRNINLKKNEIYLYDAFTEPEFRGKSIFPRVLTDILKYGKRQGYHMSLIFALSSNHPSLRAIKKAGFTRFQSVYFISIYNKTFCKTSGVKNGESCIKERFIKAIHP